MSLGKQMLARLKGGGMEKLWNIDLLRSTDFAWAAQPYGEGGRGDAGGEGYCREGLSLSAHVKGRRTNVLTYKILRPCQTKYSSSESLHFLLLLPGVASPVTQFFRSFGSLLKCSLLWKDILIPFPKIGDFSYRSPREILFQIFACPYSTSLSLPGEMVLCLFPPFK